MLSKSMIDTSKSQIFRGDCLEIMPHIPDQSVDMILSDLPYGTTAEAWDHVIPMDKLWNEYKRIIKSGGVILLTAQNPFASDLIQSNRKMFRYNWVWEKSNVVGFLNSKKMPMRKHEQVLVFYKKLPTYNPQGLTKLKNPTWRRRPKMAVYSRGMKPSLKTHTNYPHDIIHFDNPPQSQHPTQKPVALFEYLIKTYTNAGMLVLDNCAGSGTTGIACLNLDRKFILIEKEKSFYEMIKNRIREWGRK